MPEGVGELVGGGKGAFCAVNPHCLESIVRLSDHLEVRASSDIFDEKGTKLWAKGAPVSPALHEKMLKRRLRQPLETSLDVERGASMENIVDDCFALMQEKPVLDVLGGIKGAKGMLRSTRNIKIPGPLKLLLTSAREHKKNNYDIGLAGMIICSGLAYGLGLNDHDSGLLILSALVHDIGEMYINPDYLHEKCTLRPDEWKHVASHPCVGQAFLKEFTSFPATVTDCVLHHHERLDGSGYPFQVPGSNLSLLSKLICVADSASAIVMRRGDGLRERLAVALRIAPEEFPRPAVSLIINALASFEEGSGAVMDINHLETVSPILQRLAAAREIAEALVREKISPRVESAGEFAITVLRSIDKSLRATGVYELSQLGEMQNDTFIMSEISVVLAEVKWRLRNLARNIYLRIEKGGEAKADLENITELIAVLSGEPERRLPN